MSVCWNSVTCVDALLLSHGRTFVMDEAKAVGLAEVVQRLIDFTAHLRLLQLDHHEFVALKVLLLMTPGGFQAYFL